MATSRCRHIRPASAAPTRRDDAECASTPACPAWPDETRAACGAPFPPANSRAGTYGPPHGRFRRRDPAAAPCAAPHAASTKPPERREEREMMVAIAEHGLDH